MAQVAFSSLVGKVITNIEKSDKNHDMTITTSDGVRYKMHHEQDCCEHVAIEEIIGDINSVLNKVVVVAGNTETTSSAKEDGDSATRTDFLISTGDSEVVIRWLGESNGYYSEGVTFETID